MSNRVQVLDTITKVVLFECSIAEMDSAYKKAQEFEAMGLDIELNLPGVSETLMESLGADKEDILLDQLIIEEESCSHYKCESRF